MNRFNCLVSLVAIIGLLAVFYPARGLAVECHCFQQRSYVPADKFAADTYILASSFNSFLAGASPISKRQIIMLKMRRGVTDRELIPGLYLARLLHIPFQEILPLRQSKGKWSDVLEALGGEYPEDHVIRAMQKDQEDARISALATATMIGAYFGVERAEVREYFEQGFSEREIVLALGLAEITGKPVSDIIAAVREEGASWGEIASAAGIRAEDIGDRIGLLGAGDQ